MITIYKGDAATIDFEFTIEENRIETPVNITGYTLRATLVKKKEEPPYFDKEITNHIDATNGITECKIEPIDTVNLQAGKYNLFARLYDAYGNPTTIGEEEIDIQETPFIWRQ